MPLIYKVQRCWFGPNKLNQLKAKSVIISEERPKSYKDKIWSMEVVLEKTADGKDVLKVTVKTSRLGGGQAGNSKQDRSFDQQNTQS
jgi:hypothetical protein